MLSTKKVQFPMNQVFWFAQEETAWSTQNSQKITWEKRRECSQEELDKLSTEVNERLAIKRPSRNEAQFPISKPEDTTTTTSSDTVEARAPQTPSKIPTQAADACTPRPYPSNLTELNYEDEPDYDKEMQNLCVQIHKISGEWYRKGREFEITLVKSNNHALTRGCPLETSLEEVCTKAKEYVTTLQGIESEYARKVRIQISQRIETVSIFKRMGELIKGGNKLKFSWGGLHLPPTAWFKSQCALEYYVIVSNALPSSQTIRNPMGRNLMDMSFKVANTFNIK